MALTERLALLITADATQAVRSLDGVGNASQRLGQVEPRLSRVGSTLTRTLTPAALATGAAAMTMFNQFDEGADALRAAGAVGDQFTESMKNVGNQVPESLGEVGRVMGEVYQRTRLTGEPLEQLTQQVIELGRLGQNVSVEQLTASLTKAGVSAEGMSDALDVMYRVTQTTGTSVEKLSSLQEQFGAVLAETGLPLEEQLLLLGQMEAQGVNTSAVMGGLTRAYRSLSDSTDDPAAALQDLMQRMADAGSVAEATALGTDVLGRSAVEVAAAAQSGALDIDALTEAYAQNTDTVHEAGAGMLDLSDKFKILMNRVVGVVGPFGEVIFGLSTLGVAAGPALSGISKLSTAIGNSTTAQFAASQASSRLGMSYGTMAAGALGAAAVIGGTLIAVWQESEEAARRAEQAAAGFADAIDAAGDPLSGVTAELDRMVRSAPEAATAMGEAGVTTRELAEAAMEGGAAWADLRAQLTDVAGSQAGPVLDQIRQNLLTGAEAASNYDEVLGGATDATSALGDEASAAANAYEALNDAITATFDPVLAYTDALREHEQAQAESNAAMASGTATADELRDADMRVRDSALALVSASNSLNGVMDENPEIANRVTAALDGMAAQGLITTAQAASFKAEIQAGVSQLNTLSSSQWQVNLNTSQASASLSAMLNQAAQLQAAIGGSLAGNQAGLPKSSERSAPVSPRRDRGITMVMDGQTVGRVTGERMRRDGEAAFGVPLGVAG